MIDQKTYSILAFLKDEGDYFETKAEEFLITPKNRDKES